MALEVISFAHEMPMALTLLLFGAILIGIQGERLRARMASRAWRRKKYGGANARPFRSPIKSDPPAKTAADQMQVVIAACFSPRPLLNKSERRLFAATERAVREEAPQWRVMAQVSLGEILSSPSEPAFRAINSKRVDLLLIDDQHMPLHAIEYQGDGHHQGTAAIRDAVKKEALRRAGIGYVEIRPGDTPADMRAIVAKLAKAKETLGA